MTGLSNTKVLGRAMVNTLGLIILVGFLGYGLVEVPRSLWNKGDVAGQLRFLQFKVAVQSEELQSARRKLEETLELVHSTDAQLKEEARAASTQSFTRLEKHMNVMVNLCSKARVPPCACRAHETCVHTRMHSACTCTCCACRAPHGHARVPCACRAHAHLFARQTTLSWVRQPSDPNLAPQRCQKWPSHTHTHPHAARSGGPPACAGHALWAHGEAGRSPRAGRWISAAVALACRAEVTRLAWPASLGPPR